MLIRIYSYYHVEIIHTAGTTTLEYDDAADFMDAVADNPQACDDFADRAVAAFGVDE